MEIKRGGLVTLKDVHTGYTYNEEEQVGEAEAVGKEGKYSFPMRILFSRTAILHAECHCKECERNYWRFYEQKYCAYTAAALKLVEEQTNKEIARRLGINESTVASRVMRGRNMLKAQLEKEGYTYAAV